MLKFFLIARASVNRQYPLALVGEKQNFFRESTPGNKIAFLSVGKEYRFVFCDSLLHALPA